MTPAEATRLAARIRNYFLEGSVEATPSGMRVITRPAIGDYNTEFYDYLEYLFKHPRTNRCWFSGAGFDLRTKAARVEATKLVGAMRSALDRGVEIERVHTGGKTSPEYARILAGLASNGDTAGKFTLYLLRSDTARVSDVFLINPGDPRWNVSELMIETAIRGVDAPARLAGSALFVHSNEALARDLRERFELMRNNATRVEAPDIEHLLSGECLYFAYGSNMHRDQMLRRIQTAEWVGRAALRGYRLTFDQPAKYREGAVASIRAQADATVWGVVWRIPAMDLPRLDRIEDLTSYDRMTVEVDCEERAAAACEVYVAKEPREGLFPEEGYLATMLLGAIEAKVPGEYLRRLRRQETIEDHRGRPSS